MRKILIDLTSLLDVVLILLFVAINGSAAKYENAAASAQQAQSDYEQLIVEKSDEYDTLISEKQSEYDKMITDGQSEIDEIIKNQDDFLSVLEGEYDKVSAEKKSAESVVNSYGFIGQKIGTITVAFVKPEKTGTAMLTFTVNGDTSKVKTYVIASENELKNYVTMWVSEALNSFEEKDYDIVFIVYEFDYENITITQSEIIDGVLSGKAEGKTVYYKIKK